MSSGIDGMLGGTSVLVGFHVGWLLDHRPNIEEEVAGGTDVIRGGREASLDDR